MGSFIEVNDTLQLTAKQGFPRELKLERHLKTPYTAKNFKRKLFAFIGKPNIRIYHAPPVRNFLVENRGGKWIYWGLVHVLEVRHDYIRKSTSGKFRIIHLYTPDEMKKAHELTDRNKKTQFFS